MADSMRKDLRDLLDPADTCKLKLPWKSQTAAHSRKIIMTPPYLHVIKTFWLL